MNSRAKKLPLGGLGQVRWLRAPSTGRPRVLHALTVKRGVIVHVYEDPEIADAFRDPETEKPRVFESHVVIEFDRSIDAALRVFDPVRQAIAKSVARSPGEH
jgi:hypothetical protein